MTTICDRLTKKKILSGVNIMCELKYSDSFMLGGGNVIWNHLDFWVKKKADFCPVNLVYQFSAWPILSEDTFIILIFSLLDT